ncbi:anthocyanidin 5,3-O-glucosyltransferase-like [Rutidosis leptorrhynchoides]|uniref:anthocyanidin 5,3-O-glucosyltransferase-like n=1 Tax=Rutidosis leptorrhynchoides TaxID=125765 RepID=UPI003A999A8C
MENDSIVLYPSQGRGHLFVTIELGNRLLAQYPSFSIHIIISTAPSQVPVSATELSAAVTGPSISFHHLPPTSLSKTYTPQQAPDLSYDLAELSNPKLHESLLKISETSVVKALIIDFFNTSAFQVSSQLEIPTYFFFTSGAGALAVFLYFPTIHEHARKSLKDLDGYQIEVPGLPPVPSIAMPVAMLDRTTEVYHCFMKTALQFTKCDGIILNSFELLEKRMIDSILNRDCTPGMKTPPLYCIGPVITNGDSVPPRRHECLTWLDSQPSRSVVFLCFGSTGVFSSKQLNEIAVALETSNVRFLWVVRKPPQSDQDPTLKSFLPHGFVSRTNDRGVIVDNWAPQVEVLSHDSVGAFVTHCGWNSILEAVRAGVPMLAWPLYAEQKLNRVFLVEEMKVALWVAESDKDGLVSASELEKRLTELLDSEKGREVRKRVEIMRDGAIAAMREGESSTVALKKLILSLKQEHRRELCCDSK